MELTNEQKYEQGKHLLEYFVSHLEWVKNHDISFKGYEAYIKPHIDAGDFVSKGWGYRGGLIQGMISPWQDFGDAPGAQRVCLTVSNFGADNAKTYLHWYNTAISIKAHWERVEPDSNVWCIQSLYICFYNGPAVKESSLDELGLFDGKAPNDELKQFWSEFDSMWWKKINSDDGVKMLDDLVDILSNNKNLILTGAPGTGKTYLARQLARYLITGSPAEDKQYETQYAEQIDLVQFHPSYDYTDFVEGLRPYSENGQIGFKLVDGNFKDFCRKAADDQDNCYVFIIDEINRGEVSKIFGELFFAVDPDYRGKAGKVKTQYQNIYKNIAAEDDPFKEQFFVPDNVYVIGTMNDIDRSIEPIDFAFRRRFAWYEVEPRSRLSMLEEDNLNLSHLDLSQEEQEVMQSKLKQASFYKLTSTYCKNLNKAISGESCLGSKYQIGPAYFFKTTNFIKANDITEESVKEALNSVWTRHLEPLLREYLRGRSKDDTESIINTLHKSYNDSNDGEQQ